MVTSKKLWSLLQNLKKTLLILTDLEKANLFNSSFQNFFTVDNNIPFSAPTPLNHMPPFQIQSDDVYRACKKMNKKLSRTPEGIPSFFISHTINSLLFPLTTIFNLFLRLGFVPSQWKCAEIVPVFKKGDRRKVGNYRPVSLTSSISRLFEAVLLEKLMSYALENHLLSKFQFGFLPTRTSCGNLLSSIHSWLTSLLSSKCTNVFYTDIKKAFDSVNHRILIQILISSGFNTDVVSWISNFLCDRIQKVCINNATSSALPVYSGVPQGSVLGPFLFLIYYDKITNILNHSSDLMPTQISDQISDLSIRLFADDCKIFSSQPQVLQKAMDNSHEWLSTHQLDLARDKCAILKIKKSAIQENTTFSLDHVPIQEVTKFKDLGILVTGDLNWSTHIDYICHRASITSFQITKSLNSKIIWTWLKLYQTYIRPKLESNTQIWSPFLIKDVNKIESIQRKFTRFAFNKCSISNTGYEDRLRKINMLSLKQRRVYFDLALMFKMINNISDLQFNDYFYLITTKYSLRSHTLQINTKNKFNSSRWHNSYFGRIPSLWNVLPSHIVLSPSLNTFKIALKAYLLN